jgi:hypothetical protein
MSYVDYGAENVLVFVEKPREVRTRILGVRYRFEE